MKNFPLVIGPTPISVARDDVVGASSSFLINGRVMATTPPSFTFQDLMAQPDLAKGLRKEVQFHNPELSTEVVLEALATVEL